MSKARAFAYRQKALQAYDKAMRADISEATRRAWLIVERDWMRMAKREKLKQEGAYDGDPREQRPTPRSVSQRG